MQMIPLSRKAIIVKTKHHLGESMLRHWNSKHTCNTKSPLHQCDFSFKLND
jgi:hypothetical protein